MSVDPGLLDANVLAYAVDEAAPQHVASRRLLNEARDPASQLFITSQVLCEFYSIITNFRRVARPSTPVEAIAVLKVLLALPGLHILPMPAQSVELLLGLLQRRPVSGGAVFDSQIAAVMLANGVSRIYTFNTKDFTAFPELIAVAPAR